MASTALRKAASRPVSSAGRRSSTFAAVAQAQRDQHALGHQPGSAVEDGGGAAGPRVEAGRVDHQHRGPVAAQEPAPGEVDRLARAAALGETRLLQALQPLQGRQGLGAGEAGQGAVEGRRRRQGARQGRRPPASSHAGSVCSSLMAPPYAPPGGSATMWRA